MIERFARFNKMPRSQAVYAGIVQFKYKKHLEVQCRELKWVQAHNGCLSVFTSISNIGCYLISLCQISFNLRQSFLLGSRCFRGLRIRIDKFKELQIVQYFDWLLAVFPPLEHNAGIQFDFHHRSDDGFWRFIFHRFEDSEMLYDITQATQLPAIAPSIIV